VLFDTRGDAPLLITSLILVLSVLPASMDEVVLADELVSGGEASPLPRRAVWTESRVIGFPDPPPPFHIQPVFANIDFPKPLSVTTLPGTKDLLVTVHGGGYGGPGRLLRLSGDESNASVSEFLKIDDIIYGIAFHPDFAANGYMYVGCNGNSETLGKKATRVLRFEVSPAPSVACDVDSKTVIIEWESNGHNGGDLVFGHDGMLYVSAGDGTSDSDAKLAGQDLSTIPGSMIRIDIDHQTDNKRYSIPPDNPFLDMDGARPEIWAYGLRNPWRISLDPVTGDLWAGINGQDQWETVQVVRRGENYGWSVNEGSHPFQPNRPRGPTPIVPPTIEHPHSEARSLTGGHVYYGLKHPSLHGHYLYGDYSTGAIWAAKYDGTAVVSHFLVARTSLQISGFGIDHDGELLVVDHGSGLYRLVPNEQRQSTEFPRRLSDTGIFRSVHDHVVAAGIIPYQVNAPLWSDGTEKERFIGLPGDAQIGFRMNDGWEFPDGTVLVKTFSLPLTNGTPNQTRRIETRLMSLQDGQWYGYSYEWNDEQTDAFLVDAKGKNVDLTLSETENESAAKKQTWSFPSRSDCMVCHSRVANYALGLSVLQTNRNVNVEGKDVSQLEHFVSLGLFEETSETHHKSDAKTVADHTRKFELPSPVDVLSRLVDPADPSLPLELRARSYLHSNCAHCHVRQGGGNSPFTVKFDTSLSATRLVNEIPAHDAFGVTDARLVVPKNPHRSLLLHRMQFRGRGQMPPLATSLVDQDGVKMLSDWIQSLEEKADGEAVHAIVSP
jgi:uncharacterized repeat protein (TIGR03806 family)